MLIIPVMKFEILLLIAEILFVCSHRTEWPDMITYCRFIFAFYRDQWLVLENDLTLFVNGRNPVVNQRLRVTNSGKGTNCSLFNANFRGQKLPVSSAFFFFFHCFVSSLI